MTANPFVDLWNAPVATLTAAAYAVVLLAAILATWYALARNALWLEAQYQNGWQYLPPLLWTARAVGGLLVIALDLLLAAGVIYVLS